MGNNSQPQQISLFEALQDRSVCERERERESKNGLLHSYEHIISLPNLLDAWREFARDKKGQNDVSEFSVHLLDNIFALRLELVEKTYRHGPYRPARINDPKPRDIHIASVRDRLLHHAIYRVVYPYFDKTFVFDSYSCRRRKGTHRAMNRFREYARDYSHNHARTIWVLKCDIRKFFANIDHIILKGILAGQIKDADTLRLFDTVIYSFDTEGKPNVGLPLGNLTSQLLVNVYMNEFDQYVKHKLKVKYYVRYADDFVILQNNKIALIELLSKISSFLSEKLKLTLHPDKVFIKTFASGVDFLGWVHFHDHRVLRTSTKRRMFRRLGGNHKVEVMESYLGLLSHGNTSKIQKRIQKCFS